MRILALFFLALMAPVFSAGFVCAKAAASEPDARGTGPTGVEEISIPKGITRIDLDGDGEPDFVVKAWRENFNAHGYSVFLFAVSNKAEAPSKNDWLLVPFEKAGEPSVDSVSTIEGADCRLRTIRVFRGQRDGVHIVIAERPLLRSFHEQAPVEFRIFGLEKNESEIPGTPPFSFVETHHLVSKAPYCDADKALNQEKHILKMIR